MPARPWRSTRAHPRQDAPPRPRLSISGGIRASRQFHDIKKISSTEYQDWRRDRFSGFRFDRLHHQKVSTRTGRLPCNPRGSTQSRDIRLERTNALLGSLNGLRRDHHRGPRRPPSAARAVSERVMTCGSGAASAKPASARIAGLLARCYGDAGLKVRDLSARRSTASCVRFDVGGSTNGD